MPAPEIGIGAIGAYLPRYRLSAEEIARYVASGEPRDKAGAYAIQGFAGAYIPRIDGCYFNVVGLPVALVSNMVEGVKKRLRKDVAAAR